MNREVTETDLRLYRTAVSMLERSYSPFRASGSERLF